MALPLHKREHAFHVFEYEEMIFFSQCFSFIQFVHLSLHAYSQPTHVHSMLASVYVVEERETQEMNENMKFINSYLTFSVDIFA